MTAIPLLQPTAPDQRVSLLDFSLPELEAFLAELGQPKFRARQVWEWIYKRYVADFDAMTNLPKPLRDAVQGLIIIAAVAYTAYSTRKTR